MNAEQRQLALLAIGFLQAGMVPEEDEGICANFEVLTDGEDLINEICNVVERLTGLPFPIEGDGLAYDDNRDKWRGKWLRKRQALMRRLVREIERMDAEVVK